jgi:hypothetical protein
MPLAIIAYVTHTFGAPVPFGITCFTKHYNEKSKGVKSCNHGNHTKIIHKGNTHQLIIRLKHYQVANAHMVTTEPPWGYILHINAAFMITVLTRTMHKKL